MDKWIEILKADNYPQGNVTVADINLMAANYNPSYIQAPVIAKHRMFNDKGELINNEPALGWIKALRAKDGSLFALFENNNDLKNIYDGKSFRYGSVEIQTENINGKNTPYLGALAVTNFPASKIQQIRLNDQTIIKVYSQQLNYEGIEMKPEQFKQLCKTLELKEDSTPDEVVAHVTQLIAKVKDADAVTKLTEALKLIKVEEPQKKDEENSDVKKLTATVNELSSTVKNFAIQLDTNAVEKTETVFNQGITDKKLLPSQKDLLVGTKDKPGTYFRNADGLKKFVDTLPVLQINQQITLPKDQTGKPLTYVQLLNNMKLYNEMQKNDPAAFKALKDEWLQNPSAPVEEKK